MATGGIFVTLYDEETLNLYLEQGVYGQHMTPQEDEPSPYSAHYRTLADYGAVRDGYHVFFFLDRKVYYGGQIVGSDDYGAFYINGRKSPLGREADAPLVWDESSRDAYDATDEPGVFRTDDDDDGTCQPFLIGFKDEMGMAEGSLQTSRRNSSTIILEISIYVRERFLFLSRRVRRFIVAPNARGTTERSEVGGWEGVRPAVAVRETALYWQKPAPTDRAIRCCSGLWCRPVTFRHRQKLASHGVDRFLPASPS